ncbi:hypothetical protein J6590_050944, partial [Homalodisca vitripennis]
MKCSVVCRSSVTQNINKRDLQSDNYLTHNYNQYTVSTHSTQEYQHRGVSTQRSINTEEYRHRGVSTQKNINTEEYRHRG